MADGLQFSMRTDNSLWSIDICWSQIGFTTVPWVPRNTTVHLFPGSQMNFKSKSLLSSNISCSGLVENVLILIWQTGLWVSFVSSALEVSACGSKNKGLIVACNTGPACLQSSNWQTVVNVLKMAHCLSLCCSWGEKTSLYSVIIVFACVCVDRVLKGISKGSFIVGSCQKKYF